MLDKPVFPLYIDDAEAMRWKEGVMARLKPVHIIKRGKMYQLYYYSPRGERRRLSVGNDYESAQLLAVRFNDWLIEGKDPESELQKAQQKETMKTITVREFFPMFIERHGKLRSFKMQMSYQSSFKNVCRCPYLVDSEMGTISKRLVLDYMYARIKSDGVKAATVNREAALLKCMVSKAAEWGILESNILQGLKLLPESEKREVFVTLEQARELISSLPNPIDDIIEFAVYTGFRKENILSLCIDSIRFHDLSQTGEVIIHLKGNRLESFPLGPTAVELLKRVIGAREEGFVFINPHTGTRYVSIHKTFDRAVVKLGLTVNGTKLRIHDLRHVFATWLHREGVSLDALRFLMGHKNRATTDRYTTIDRLSIGNVLSLMPHIRNPRDEKTLNIKDSGPVLTQTDTKRVVSI